MRKSESPMLYHATYQPLLKSIMVNGLGNTKRRNYEDSKRGFVCFSYTKDVAISYAETSDLVPETYLDKIVVLEVAVKDLSPNQISLDGNIQDNNGDCIQYKGVIPWGIVKLVENDSLNEKNPTSKKKTKVTTSCSI